MSNWNLDRIPESERGNIKQMNENGEFVQLISLFYDLGVIPGNYCHSCVFKDIKDWVKYYLEVHYTDDGRRK